MEIEELESKTKAGTNRNYLVSTIALSVSLMAVLAWYVLAFACLNRHIKTFETALLPVHEAKSQIVENGRPRTVIDHEKLSSYVRSFELSRQTLENAIFQIESGEGIGFWFPDRCKNEAGLLSAILVSENELVGAARQALATTNSMQSQVTAVLRDSEQSYNEATALLSPQSDSQDFEEGTATLVRTQSTITDQQAHIQAQGPPLLSGMTEQFRAGLLVGFSSLLATEAGRISGRRQTLEQAALQLSGYKEAAKEIGGENYGLLSGLGNISTVLQPAVGFAYTKTHDLLRFIEAAEQPIGGEIGSDFSTLLGFRSSAPATPLSIASQIYPSAGLVWTGLKETCNSIERIHSEVENLSDTTNIILPPLRSFLATKSRVDLLALSKAAPITVRYFEERRGLFDPAIASFETSRSRLDALSSAISMARVPRVQAILQQILNGAYSILNAAEAPFREGSSIIEKTRKSMRELEYRETQYVRALNTLRARSVWPASTEQAGAIGIAAENKMGDPVADFFAFPGMTDFPTDSPSFSENSDSDTGPPPKEVVPGEGVGGSNEPSALEAGIVRHPLVLHEAKPSYTEEARKARVEGKVVLRLVVRGDGTTDDFEVIRGLGFGLDESAISTIQNKWRFRPGTRNGAPVDVPIHIEINYTLF